MALKNPITKEYLKITQISFNEEYCSSINYKIYANQEHRVSGDSIWLVAKQGAVNSGILQFEFDRMADQNLSINDNIKSAGYRAIKADTFDFSNWEDC